MIHVIREHTGISCHIFSDIDECSQSDLNDCDENAQCSNINGGFNCNCNAGYQGSGVQCAGNWSRKLLTENTFSSPHYPLYLLKSYIYIV